MNIDLPILSAVLVFTFEWALRLWFLLYIPRKRQPSSAIAWLLLVLLFPAFGVLLFFLIGSPKLNKRRRQQQKYIDGLIEAKTKHTVDRHKVLSGADLARYSPIIDLAQSLGKMPISVGNKAEIFPEYDKAIVEITKQINLAKEFVHLEYFILTLDETTQPLFDALEKAVARGVTVRVLFDALGIRAFPNNKMMMSELTRMGIQWHKILPIRLGKKYNRPDLRNHRKIVVIDDETAYLGSQNMIARTYHRKDDIIYDELVVKLNGPVVRQCNALFVGDWYAETNEQLRNLVDPTKRPMPGEVGSVMAQVVPSGPGFDVLGNLQLFTQLMYTAKKRIFITNPYFVPDESLMTACKSAAQRGVEVIMLNSEVMDQAGVGNAQRSFYEELLEAGVQIYLYNAPILLHSKHLTIDDDIAVIGSSNMDIRSFALDLECVVTLYDKKVVSDLKKVQAKNLKRSTKVSLKKWRKRSLKSKFIESITRLTSAIQ